MLEAGGDGWSVYIESRRARRGEAYRSEMARGLWLGVVVAGELETEEQVFGRRRWSGPSATLFYAPTVMPSDHFILADSDLTSLFVHLDARAAGSLGLKIGRASWR